jgi:hypothetical protein
MIYDFLRNFFILYPCLPAGRLYPWSLELESLNP